MIFSTKDYTAAKSDKVRLAVAKKRGLTIPATRAQVEQELEQHLRELMQILDRTAYDAAFTPDPTD